jgi:hypothetical protein
MLLQSCALFSETHENIIDLSSAIAEKTTLKPKKVAKTVFNITFNILFFTIIEILWVLTLNLNILQNEYAIINRPHLYNLMVNF